MNPYRQPWLDRAFSAALSVLLIALCLTWAWALLKPLVPVLLAGVVLTALVRIGWSRWRYDRF